MDHPDILAGLLADELLQRTLVDDLGAARVRYTPLCIRVVEARLADVNHLDFEDSVKLLLPELIALTGLPETTPPPYGATGR